MPGGLPKLFLSTDSNIMCRQEPGGPYSCLIATSDFLSHISYSFQVAAENDIGTGSLSDPVITIYASNGTHITIAVIVTYSIAN